MFIPTQGFSNFKLIGYSWSDVRPSSVSPSVVHNAQRSSPKPLDRSKPNFMWSLLGYGEFCSRHLGHMTKMAATPIYG